MLVGGALTTKSLAQSAQTSFAALTGTANQLLFAGAIGDSDRASSLTPRFRTGAEELTLSLDGVIQALNADPLVDKGIIAGLVAHSGAAKKTLYGEYMPLISKLADIRNYGGDAGQVTADFEKSVAISQRIAGDIDAVFQGIAKAGDDVYSGYVAFLLATILKLKIFIVIAVACSIVLVVILGLIIKKPFESMMRTLEEIAAEWDMTKRFEIYGKDETGRLAGFFNLTFEKMEKLLKDIKDQSAAMSDLGIALAANMNESAAAVNQIAAAIQNIKSRMLNQSASVTETTAAMEQITGNIGKLSGHVDRQTLSVSQSSSAVEEMLANIQSVTQTLVKNADNVRELMESSDAGRSGLREVAADIQEIARESEGLLEINAVMENIASQTNLLSMNAAIEAAHAGEAGKGFAVVADEIRKLAESSSEQSKTIGTVLKKIKGSIDTITYSTGKVLDKFEAIDNAVRIVSDQETNIRAAMEEQGAGSKQILDAIAALNGITGQVKGGSEEMLSGSRGVIRESKNLGIATEEITRGINEMAAATDQINTAINQVNELSLQNRDNIDMLVRQVSVFKIA
jgi:methyl-accepting chemotaxis protein